MFCENELIKTYLMVLTIIFSLHYCELKETTAIEKLVPDSKIKDMTNLFERRTPTNYKRHLDLHHLIRKRKQHFKTRDLKLKQEFDKQIFQQNLQLLQDQTKKSLLKLQNAYLENFYIKDPQNKYQTSIQTENSNKNYKIKLRIRRDDAMASETNENSEIQDSAASDDEDEVTTETSKQLLEEIVSDLDEIRESSIVPPGKGKTCQLNGTWISDIVGVGFNITFCESLTLHDTNITQPLTTTTSPTTTITTETPNNDNLNQTESIFIGGAVVLNSFEIPLDEDSDHLKLLNCSWDMKARIPFSHTTMLIITAEFAPENRVAVFVGQCRYCDRTEMVIGQWMFQKLVHDCRKVPTAQDVFGDVLRRQPRTAC